MKKICYIIVCVCIAVSLYQHYNVQASGFPVYDLVAMLQRLESGVQQLQSYQVQIEQYQTAIESLKMRAKNLSRLHLDLKNKKGLEASGIIISNVTGYLNDMNTLYNDIKTLAELPNVPGKVGDNLKSIANEAKQRADKVAEKALQREIKNGQISMQGLNQILENLALLNKATLSAEGNLQISQVNALSNQQIASLIALLIRVQNARAETERAEKIQAQAKEQEQLADIKRYHSQQAVCKPKRQLKTIGYPEGYEPEPIPNGWDMSLKGSPLLGE